jgi:hypothetical protein
LGGSWRKAKVAGGCHQARKEAGGFLDRQVITEGTEKAQIETLTFDLAEGMSLAEARAKAKAEMRASPRMDWRVG